MPFELPYFPFYPADFLLDGKCAVMTLEQVGAYIKLLCYQWREGEIPSNQNQIATLLGVDSQAIARLMPGLDKCFPSGQNRRLEEIRKELIDRSTKLSEAGKRRWNKKLIPHSQAIARLKPGTSQAIARARLILKEFLGKLKDKEKALKFSEVWDLWVKHRKEIHKTLTPTTIEKQLAFLEKQPDPVAVINQSIEKGWTGLFELKTNGHQQEGKTQAGGVRGELGKYDALMEDARKRSEL